MFVANPRWLMFCYPSDTAVPEHVWHACVQDENENGTKAQASDSFGREGDKIKISIT